MMMYHRFVHFFRIGMWRSEEENHSLPMRLLLHLLRRTFLAVRFFIKRGHGEYATSLSFSTILAIVPIAAVVFAVGKGFGLSAYLERWLRDVMTGQPQVAEWIIRMSDSYLDHARTGIVIGIGIVFMLYSVLSLVYHVESVFNEIWQVKKSRPVSSMLVGYTSMLFLVPVVLILLSGVNIYVYAFVDSLQSYRVLGWMVQLLIKLIPLILMTVAFLLLYMVTPNTGVHFRHAVGPAVLAAVGMWGLQFVYINSQLFLSGYNAIYGSFAALPLFMLWVMVSWYICLFCAELCYASQNLDYYTYLISTDKLSHRSRLMLSAVLLGYVCRRFDEARPAYTALQLRMLTGVPIRVVTDLLYEMCERGLLVENTGTDNEGVPTYQPAQSIRHLTVARLFSRLSHHPDALKHIDVDLRSMIDPDALTALEREGRAWMGALEKLELKDFIRKQV